MTDQAVLAGDAVRTVSLKPDDRRIATSPVRVFSIALSLLVLGAALFQMRNVSVTDIVALVPSSPFFWMVFALTYFAGPISEWLMFRRIWHVGPAAFGALVRKLIYNEMLLGYLGEAYFYTWARRNLRLAASPFGAVKDVAVLSAVAGNALTFLFLAIAAPYLALLPLHDYAHAIAWSLALVIGTSLVAMVWRRAIFSLDRADLAYILALHSGRILATAGLSALLWHLVMPGVGFVWWLVLATMRLLISRLPFVPNKDLVFAGIAILAVGNDLQLGELMTMMAALILLTHILVGMTFAALDLLHGGRNAEGAR